MASTAKEGFFKRETTIIFEIHGSGKLSSHYKPVAKILYQPSMSKLARLEWHNRIVGFIEELTLREQPPSSDDAVSALHGHLLGQDGIENVCRLDF